MSITKKLVVTLEDDVVTPSERIFIYKGDMAMQTENDTETLEIIKQIYIGDINISDIKMGDSSITKVYIGDLLI